MGYEVSRRDVLVGAAVATAALALPLPAAVALPSVDAGVAAIYA